MAFMRGVFCFVLGFIVALLAHQADYGPIGVTLGKLGEKKALATALTAPGCGQNLLRSSDNDRP